MKLLKTILFLYIASCIFADDVSEDQVLASTRYEDLTKEQKEDLDRRKDGKLTFEKNCDLKLLQSFNLFGRDTSSLVHLEFCPKVVNSCCTLVDQRAIYDNWISSRELETMNTRFANFTLILEKFIDLAEEINDGASKVLENMASKENNECKLMARRILSYQIEDLKNALLQQTKEAFNFMKQTFKGFYCALCNADESEFILSGSKKIIVTERFCRSVITNTLSSILYYRVHFPRFINLVSTFAATCDIQGKFVQATLKPGIIVEVKIDEAETIEKCFNSRNHPIWLNNCQEICQKWNPGEIDEYFLPGLSQLALATEHLDKKIDKFASLDKSKRRVLEDNKMKQTKKINTQYQKIYSNQERRLGDALHPNKLIASYLNGTLPNLTDSRGYPLNRTNFTNFGANLTAQQYVDYIENIYNTSRSAVNIDPESRIVYVSQNLSISASLSEYTIEVQTNGTDFYREGQFARFNMDLISDLLPMEKPVNSTNTTDSKGPRNLNIDENHSKISKKERKLKNKKRKLKSSWILKSMASILLIFFVKL